MRARSATPGTILCLASAACLAVVSFNTPLLKSLYFLEATFSSGTYAGTLKLGTLGYCLTEGGTETCVGPTVGYEFDPNTLFNVTVFSIPETITKYLTYTLILHIIALACAVAATIFGLLSHISTLSLLCFPTCTASMASSFSLLALIFDLVIFYIAKARIDSVSGASASIGQSVWLTLAAWLLAGLSGCAYGLGRCCVGRRRTQEPGDARYPAGKPYYNDSGPDQMRLYAIRDEQLRKKEAGLPAFQDLERTPLTDAGEDKYLYEDAPTLPSRQTNNGAGASGLRRDGSLLQGVGVGYGRRHNGQARGGASQYPGAYPTRGYGYDDVDSVSNAGAAGIGAGAGGIDVPQQQHDQYEQYGHSYDPYGEPHNDQYHDGQHQGGYADPYAAPQQQGYGDGYRQYDQGQAGYGHAMPMPAPAPAAALGPHDYYTGPLSSDSHVPSQQPYTEPVAHHDSAYDAYDDGLGAIGRAVTSPTQATYSAGNSGGGGGSNYYGQSAAYPTRTSGGQNDLYIPQPQHLVGQSRSDLLRSPIDEQAAHGYGYDQVGGGGGGGGGGRPPSYGDVAGERYAAPPEKGGR